VKDDVTRVLNFTRLLRTLSAKHTSLHHISQTKPPLCSQIYTLPITTQHAIDTLYRRAPHAHIKYCSLRLAIPHPPNHTMHLLRASYTTTTSAPTTALPIKQHIAKHTRRTIQNPIRRPTSRQPDTLLLLSQRAPRGAPTKRTLHNRPLGPQA
jgi:hypothetical protein